jgi:tetratricopeptide (TPR) repeat protein
MTAKKETAADFLARADEEVIVELGKQSRLSWRYDENGAERELMPVRMAAASRPGPFSEPFYRAEKWLRLKRNELRKAIVEDFDYATKRADYGRGHEATLVSDLAHSIGPICQAPYPVGPLLAAAVLVKIGLDKFCDGFGEPQTNTGSRWTLESALGLDLNKANECSIRGNQLLVAGQWREAVPLFEEALALCPWHFNALNDLTCIYGMYYPKCQQGLDYARQLYRRTLDSEPAVLDTIGWTGFRHGGDLDTVEVCLQEALKWMKPGESGYISVAYHLMAVLVARQKNDEATALYQKFSHFPPTNFMDKESLSEAAKLSRTV